MCYHILCENEYGQYARFLYERRRSLKNSEPQILILKIFSEIQIGRDEKNGFFLRAF